MSDNMKYFKVFGNTPKEAQRTIQGGNLAGKTDINPMWRIKALTEVFGPAGEGWRLTVRDCREVTAVGEVMAHVWLDLAYRLPAGHWSAPVPGFGGNKIAGKGKGDALNDEAYKMAFTDALSQCCKTLGMSADIYYAKDKTKYTAPEVPQSRPYQPCDKDTYDKFVEAAAKGQLTPKGRTAEQSWISLTNAGPAEVQKFRNDVQDFQLNAGML